MSPRKDKRAKFCPVCGANRDPEGLGDRRFSGYCRRCATLKANITGKIRRGNIESDLDKAMQEVEILRMIHQGLTWDKIIKELNRGL